MTDVSADATPDATRAPRRGRTDTTRRAPALVVVALAVAGVVAAGLGVDRRSALEVDQVPLAPADLGPVAPAADALGSTWYCAGGTADDAALADHHITIANFGATEVEVAITVVPGAPAGDDPDARVVTDERTIEARSRVTIRLGDLVEAPFAAAIVEAGRGEVAVEHNVSGDGDLDIAPCASSSSSTWYVAASTTTRDASAQLLLFNPFPADAVVDITFATPDGLRAPPAFAGLIIPGQRVVAVDIGAVVSRHPNVSTSIVARSGRLVVDRIQRFDGSDGPAGLALTPAAPAPSLLWYLPDGLVAEGIDEIITVYNPTDTVAEVDIEVDLDPTNDATQPVAADPFAQSVPAHGFAQINVADDPRVPLTRGHSIVVRSQNGVPVVAERWIREGEPAPRTGLSATLGSPVFATRWLSPSGGTVPDALAEFLVLVNPATEGIARVTITASTPGQDLTIAGLEDVEVPAQSRVAIDLGTFLGRPDLMLVVESTTPIVAERGLFPVGAGFTQSILVPSAPTASVPALDTGEVLVP